VGVRAVIADAARFAEVGVASWSLESECGDAYVAQPFADGLLIAVIDGLGHGRHAADAAQLAVTTLQANPGADLPALLRACHTRLGGSRGAVMSLARIGADGTVGWVGVGNVEGRLVAQHSREARLAAPGGVIGHKLPPVDPISLTIASGDTIVLSTDGVRGSPSAIDPGSSAQANAERILAAGATHTDDALVLVVRYTGARR
jgi:phosphoserine phosphatase RsbX